MTGKPRGPGHGGDGDGPEGGDGGGRRRGGSGGGAENVAHAQDAVDAEMKLGRPTEGGGGTRPGGGQTDDGVTRPTGELGGTPEGPPTRVDPRQDDDVQRSLTRENTG